MNIQMTLERKKAYTEVLDIIDILGDSYSKKIPQKIKKYFMDNSLNAHKPDLTTGTNIAKNITNPITINLLGMLKYNYWCETEEEKQQLLRKFSENDQKKERELREKYNPDNLFKNKEKTTRIVESPEHKDANIIEYKESFFAKIINKIKKIFRK